MNGAGATICLVGAGNMGGAMLSGWLRGGHDPSRISVIDPKPSPEMVALLAEKQISLHESAAGVAAPDVVIVAVKPQMMQAVLPGLVSLVTGENVLLSVAAGTTIAQLSAPFSAVSPRVVRAMPNTPAMVQRGITVCVANPGVSDGQRRLITTLLEAVGQVAWVEQEGLIDVVTGVSGSGPAYVFHLAEALEQAGVKAGLPGELAAALARATVSGAGELLHQSELSAARLRENVTSPNGTTAAALEVLMGPGGFPDLLERAVRAAANRSRELAG